MSTNEDGSERATETKEWKQYEKLDADKHILLRPDTYVGSTHPETRTRWVWSEEGKLVFRQVEFVPALYKIFDEILVNAADNRQRRGASMMTALKVDIDKDSGTISVYNNGCGIPVERHPKYDDVYIPELVFGHLLTSSNYNDDRKKITGGRNGYGAKLTNIFSTKFVIETCDGKHKYKQTFSNNMTTKSKPVVRVDKTKKKGEWTRVTFTPDYEKFDMASLTQDAISILSRRVVDMAACLGSGVKVRLNGALLKSGFKHYASLYARAISCGEGPPKIAYAKIKDSKAKDRWEIAAMAAPSDTNELFSTGTRALHHVSFVNSIFTSAGGTHVNHVADPLARKLAKRLKVKPFQVKGRLWIFINCHIENPAFDSQTKQTLTTQSKNFGSQCPVPRTFVDMVLSKTDIRERVLADANATENAALKKSDGNQNKVVKGILKLRDANQAGRKNRKKKVTLILTEGDSAAALALSGLSVVGRDAYGVFPLKGKLLNVRDASPKQIFQNAEITNLKKIIGLKQNVAYKDTQTLRYDRIMIMVDQDKDGSHIKGLVINMFAHFWPSLFRMPGFIVEFITPIVKCTDGKQVKEFYTEPEYDAWEEKMRMEDGSKSWRIKYYKGLGTSTRAEAKAYFSNLSKHVIAFRHEDRIDDESMNLAFSKKEAHQRKTWLLDFKKGTYLDQTECKEIRYRDFVNRELILFSRASNLRAIPSLVDGLKPGQRKILFACFKRNLKSTGPSIKVAQLAGYVSEHSAYHHGEASLNSTIVKMAQNFVGSNNINLLEPDGQFGTREAGGKDAASPRYIFTKLSPFARLIFSPLDDAILHYLKEDGQVVEPEYYVPIIPMVLVNGSSGVGTGWSSSVPNHAVLDIIENIRRYLDEGPEAVLHMKPSYYGYTGSIHQSLSDESAASESAAIQCFTCEGLALKAEGSAGNIDIVELPVGQWTLPFKKNVLNPLVDRGVIKQYKEYHSDGRIRFQIKCKCDADKDEITSHLKLKKNIRMTNMHLFDENGVLRLYTSARDILVEFCKKRYNVYETRKAHLITKMKREVLRVENRVRFIRSVNDQDGFRIRDVSERELVQALDDQQYSKEKDLMVSFGLTPTKTSPVSQSKTGYEYLIDMPLRSLTMDRADALEKKLTRMRGDMKTLIETTVQEMWTTDLEKLESEVRKQRAACRSKRQRSPSPVSTSNARSTKHAKRPKMEQQES